MKGILSAVVILSLAVSDASAHYIFQKLAVSGTKFNTYEHIRYNTNYNSPVTGGAPYLAHFHGHTMPLTLSRPLLERPSL
jgi:hypothetical protein